MFFLLHIPVFMAVAAACHTGVLAAFVLTLAVLSGSTLAYFTFTNVRAMSAVFGSTAMCTGGLLVHCGQGPMQIEMHCYFFVLLALLAVFANPLAIEASRVSVVVEDEDVFDDDVGPAPIVMPIELGGMQLGQLAPRGLVDAQTVELVRSIARELAGPIRMATLVEKALRLARIDALTGLLNRRALATLVHTEIARSARYAVPFSFVLVVAAHGLRRSVGRGRVRGRALSHQPERCAHRGRAVARRGRGPRRPGRTRRACPRHGPVRRRVPRC